MRLGRLLGLVGRICPGERDLLGLRGEVDRLLLLQADRLLELRQVYAVMFAEVGVCTSQLVHFLVGVLVRLLLLLQFSQVHVVLIHFADRRGLWQRQLDDLPGVDVGAEQVVELDEAALADVVEVGDLHQAVSHLHLVGRVLRLVDEVRIGRLLSLLVDRRGVRGLERFLGRLRQLLELFVQPLDFFRGRLAEGALPPQLRYFLDQLFFFSGEVVASLHFNALIFE